MSVGVLIVTHGDLGRELVATARSTLGGTLPLETSILPVSLDCDPEKLAASGNKQIQQLDQGDGVLVLTDMFGSTPSNIANRLMGQKNVRLLTGINLPMLIRIYNYASDSLDKLADKALQGGQSGCTLHKPDE